MTNPLHTPVLLAESLGLLAPRSGGFYCDATVGLGGHAEAILEASAPDGRLVGVDRDPVALAHAERRLRRFEDRVILRRGRFSELPALLSDLRHPQRGAEGTGLLDGLLLDIGVSSLQLDEPGRGFSFRESGPLDMRMDPESGPSAVELLRALTEAELAQLLRELGEQPRARAVARAIKRYVEAEPEPDTAGLARVVAAAVPPRRPGGIHPATQTFMAIRIAVNDELSELETFLGSFLELLAPEGRLAVITFHSLEDRLVKRRFDWLCRAGADLPPGLPVTETERGPAPCVRLTRKSVSPGPEELRENPRARSARLRAIGRAPEVNP